MKKKKQEKQKKLGMMGEISSQVVIGLSVAVVILVIAVGGMLWWLKGIDTAVKSTAPTAKVQDQAAVTAVQSKKAQPSSQDTISADLKNNQDGLVEWYSSPKSIANPKIYSDDTQLSAYKAWEAGKIISGKDIGNKIILMAFQPDGPGGMMMARFMQDSDGSLTILDEYSNALSVENNEAIDTNVLNNYPAYGIEINSLDYPGVLYTPKGEKMFKVDEFPANNVDDKFENIFFRTDLLKKTFTDQVYGDFYTTDRTKLTEDNSYGTYAENGFYVKVPDGTFKVYTLAIEFMGENDVPKVIWNNGKANVSKYTFQGKTSCGVGAYADLVDGDLSANDLVPAGKTSTGDVIYELKDKNNQYLKDFYQEDVDYVNNSPEILEGKKFTKGMSYDQFVNSHTVFFWIDSFGRITRFINNDYLIDPGGCGKPVVYLYPEKTEKISVKVAPSGGITVSEPAYGEGWNVIADPMSRIKNLADGKFYPYLFWEGTSKEIYKMSKYGFVAGRDELEGLLNEKLFKLGLISKEISDFKEYWLPKMLAENKSYYFVTFVPQRKIDELAPLEINPRPDTVIRVLMDYQGLDERIGALGYDIKTPERKGFTAVEWGGVLK
jgi:hypothetical protein